MILRTSLKWGLYLGLAVSIGTQILTFLGLGLTNYFVLLTYLFVVLITVLSCRNLKNLQAGAFTFKNAFISVLVIVLIGRLIFQLYMFVYTQYIDPEWVNKVANIWTGMLQEAGRSSDAISQQISSFRKSYEPLQMFSIELLKYGLPQFILGLIVSLYFVFKGKTKK